MKEISLILICMIVAGCNAKPVDAGHSVKEWNIADIKGDALGMTRQEYASRHPQDCSKFDIDMCFGTGTYADLPSGRIATFYKGKLLSITYNIAHSFNTTSGKWDGSEVIPLLFDRFGAPERSTHKSKHWDNGTTTIDFYDEPSGDALKEGTAMLTFTNDSLQQEQAAQMERDKAAHEAAAKKDM